MLTDSNESLEHLRYFLSKMGNKLIAAKKYFNRNQYIEVSKGYPYGVAYSVQSTRPRQEDAYLMVRLGRGKLLCCVFDGHGGPFVAMWLKNNFVGTMTDVEA